MDISAVKKDGVIRVTLTGRMDMDNALKAEQAFLKYAASGSVFVLDFAGVEFIGSAGIRSLLTLYRTVEEQNGSVSIVNACDQVHEVLEETDFAPLFNIV